MTSIFIDTNVLLPDPFFKGEFASLLLKLAREKKIKLFIPSVVFEELFNRFEISLNEDLNNLKKHATSLSKITGVAFKYDKITVANQLKRLNEFYEYHFEQKHFFKVPYSNSILPELVRRSIKRIKPFSPKKEEFRDGIIWLSIVDHMKDFGDDRYFFVTNNIAEFYDANKNTLHPDLKTDYDEIKLYKSFKELIVKENELFRQKEIYDFEKWLLSENVNKEYVEEALKGYLWSSIKSELTSWIQAIDISRIYKNDIIGYLNPTLEKEKLLLIDFELLPIEKFALITCQIKMIFFAKVFKPDPIEPNFTEQGIDKFELTVEISMTLSMGSQLSLGDFESLKIQLN